MLADYDPEHTSRGSGETNEDGLCPGNESCGR